MSRLLRLRTDPDETRERILEIAEEHFRRIGYQKTAVADIAATLGMSPANVYRFFPSKAAIVSEICERVLGEVLEIARRTAAQPGSASERLEAVLIEVHLHHRETLIKDRRVHDMVGAAMSENWQAIEAYVDQFTGVIEGVIRDGVAAGEFDVEDPKQAAVCVKFAFVAFFHPHMIEECMTHGDDLDVESRKVARFLSGALRRRPA